MAACGRCGPQQPRSLLDRPAPPHQGPGQPSAAQPSAQSQHPPGSEADLQQAADHGESFRGSGKLEGRRALITGGDSGIGRAVAIAYAPEGADVAIAYLPAEEDDAQETLRGA